MLQESILAELDKTLLNLQSGRKQPPTLSKYQSEAQQALDDLFKEDLLPFQLTATGSLKKIEAKSGFIFMTAGHSIILELQKTCLNQKAIARSSFPSTDKYWMEKYLSGWHETASDSHW